MNVGQIVKHRLSNQQIAETKFTQPHEIVSWMGAMQAQEYAMAKWSIGLRLNNIYDEDIEKAFNKGEILRTHVLRPTWHFVAPADIRWMLALTAPHVNAFNGFMYRKSELDNKIFKRSNDTIVKALKGGKHLTREKLKAALAKAKIIADGHRLSYLMMNAELNAIICSGPRSGKQFTYALLDERVAPAKILHRDEALAELSTRYFKSRGPATLKDFMWWSGLPVKDAKAGIAMLHSNFVHEKIDGYDYVFLPQTFSINKKQQTNFLMPDYDEYGIGYKNRSALFNPEFAIANIPYYRFIILNGQIVGSWKRTIKNGNPVVETVLFNSLSKAKHHDVKNAVKRFSSFTQNAKQ